MQIIAAYADALIGWYVVFFAVAGGAYAATVAVLFLEDWMEKKEGS